MIQLYYSTGKEDEERGIESEGFVLSKLYAFSLPASWRISAQELAPRGV